MDIQVSEYGWGFVWECFRRFQGEGVFYLFFLAALLLLFVTARKEKGGKSWKKGVLLFFAVLAVTIYNPLLATPVIGRLGLEDEYYRLLWLLPFTVLIAWLAVSVIERGKAWWQRGLLLVCMTVLLAIPGKSILARGLTVAENLYKVPDELIEICDVIHEDSRGEEPRAAMDFDLVVLMGQYDPSIKLTLSYSDVSYMESQADMDDYTERFPPGMLSQMHIYKALYRTEEIDGVELRGALSYTETGYVVVKRDFPNMEYLYSQGLVLLTQTDTYVVLKLEEEWL